MVIQQKKIKKNTTLIKIHASRIQFLRESCKINGRTMHYRIYSVSAPSSVSINFFLTPDARAIFLHSNVLYNNIEFVTGGHENTGGEQNRSALTCKISCIILARV